MNSQQHLFSGELNHALCVECDEIIFLIGQMQ